MKQWEPSAQRAAADIEHQAAINPNVAVNIATIDGVALVERWRRERARAESAEAALTEAQRDAAKWKHDYLRVQQDNAGYVADAEEALQTLNELNEALGAVPIMEIRRAMDDTTAQHYSWYEPIRRWLDSLEVQP